MKVPNRPPMLGKDLYVRAEQFLPWNIVKLYGGASVSPIWSEDGESFVYRRREPGGSESWIRVDAATGAKEPAAPPMTGEKTWRDGELPSPDGQWAVSAEAHNIVLRNLRTGAVRTLTEDGEEDYAWGGLAGSCLEPVSQMRSGKTALPVVSWSPDSRRMIAHKVDERGLPEVGMLQSCPPDGSALPKLYRFRTSTPDAPELATAELALFDVATGRRVRICSPVLAITRETPIERGQVWWSQDGAACFIQEVDRGDRAFHIHRLDLETGKTRLIWSERGDTYVEANIGWSDPIAVVLAGGDKFLLLSERDGWMHIWLHDGQSGAELSQITKGEWVVREIVRVDEATGTIFFMASGREPGRDPYLQALYSVSAEGGEPRLITPEAAEHGCATSRRPPFLTWRGYPDFLAPRAEGLAPDGRNLVETYSTIDTAPISVLRRTKDGRVVSVLETTEDMGLAASGFRWPTPFCVKAADGVTDIYGALWLPSSYDPGGSYPVIDHIYPGPQTIRTPKGSLVEDIWGLGAFAGSAALAELGFAVVTIDGTGGPYRSKAFHDIAYRRLQRAGGLEDHVAAIRQLAARFSGLDLDRVGVFGFSGGGTATVRALFEYPDFFHAGVAAAGSHDLLGYTSYWGEKYQGLYERDAYEAARNAALAENLKGKLLLIAGELDDNCHPAMTMQVARALIQAGKDFEMLILPDQNHLTPGGQGFYTQRVWDFFVRNLLGMEPPEGRRVRGALDHLQ